MDTITLCDLEVQFQVGVPEAERAHPQRLLLTVEMDHDVSAAARGDDLDQTIDYFRVSQRLQELGKGRQWKLIESLAEEIAQLVLTEFKPQTVRVEVKKFIIPEARHVSVKVLRQKISGIPGGRQ